MVYETAGMGASAPRITALLESLRAPRPSGLPADDALEGRRRLGQRAAGRVHRGGASASDRRWVYSCRGRSKGGGRAVALAHRRPAGETRPRSPPQLSLQHFEAGAESYELLHGSVAAALQRSVRAPLQEFARADSLESLPGEFQAYLAAALVAVPTAEEPSAPM